MPMQHIVNQMTGNIPEIQPGPARRYALQMCSDIEPKGEWGGLRPGDGNKRKSMLISIDELISLRESGATFRELSEVAGVSTSTVKHRLMENGAHTPGSRISDDELREVVSMRSSGTTWAKIEDRSGRSRGALMRAARRRGFHEI